MTLALIALGWLAGAIVALLWFRGATRRETPRQEDEGQG